MSELINFVAINKRARLAVTDDGDALEITDYLDRDGYPVEVDCADFGLVRVGDRWSYVILRDFEAVSTN